MVVDGSTFLRRARIFFKDLQANRFPNAQTLAEQALCSRNTAQRTIYRLRDEYLVPFDYNTSEKGYYLTDKNYSLPSMLPPGKDELTALLLVRDLARCVDAVDLIEKLDSLWDQYLTANSSLSRELEPLVKIFSSDLTVIGDIADKGILHFIEYARSGESLELTYRSPWKSGDPRVFHGRILRVHFSDGNLYLLFREKSGREFVLNTSFVRETKVLPNGIVFPPTAPDGERLGSENWLEGFGVWAGSALHEIEIQILPPAADYYAAQRWHIDQRDEFKDGILIRRLKSIISPEIVRRILSIGGFVKSISPQALRDEVLQQAEIMCGTLGNG